MSRSFATRLPCRLAPVIAAAALSACAGASTDPHTGGLAGGITGLATGAYEQRVGEREEKLASLNDAETVLARRVGNAEARLKGLEKQIAARKTALQRLKAELSEIDRRIAVVRSTLAVEKGVEASVKATNARKMQDVAPLVAQRDLLKRMTDELEDNERRDAASFNDLRLPAMAGGQNGQGARVDTLLAAFEARSRVAETKKAEAEKLAETIKIQVARLE